MTRRRKKKTSRSEPQEGWVVGVWFGIGFGLLGWFEVGFEWVLGFGLI